MRDSKIQTFRESICRAWIFQLSVASTRVEDCQFYFEAFQTPEMYKTRMATMNFTGDAREWYRSYKIDKPHPPWQILVEEVLDFFSSTTGKPIDEFQRIQQSGSVEEYSISKNS